MTRKKTPIEEWCDSVLTDSSFDYAIGKAATEYKLGRAVVDAAMEWWANHSDAGMEKLHATCAALHKYREKEAREKAKRD